MDKSEIKIVYRYDNDGLYVGTVTLDYTDRSPISGKWQIPGYCTTVEPPQEKEGYNRVWNGEAWEYVEIPKPEPEPEPTPEEIIERKLAELDAQYNADKADLLNAYQSASMYGDTERMEKLKADLIALDTRYDEDYEAIINAEEE